MTRCAGRFSARRWRTARSSSWQSWPRAAAPPLALLHSAPRDASVALVDALGRAYKRLIKDARFWRASRRCKSGCARCINYIWRGRTASITRPEVADAALFADLRRALAAGRLGANAASFGRELIGAAELERGLWGGNRVGVDTIDALYTAGDEATLRRFNDRLPSSALREQARRRVIRLHIAASPFPEVRAHAAVVEELVLQRGSYPLALDAHPPRRGWLDANQLPVRGVLVRQNVWQQRATLLGFNANHLSVVPEVRLRGALLVELRRRLAPGDAVRPAGRAGPRRRASLARPTCGIDNPLAYLDAGGALPFRRAGGDARRGRPGAEGLALRAAGERGRARPAVVPTGAFIMSGPRI